MSFSSAFAAKTRKAKETANRRFEPQQALPQATKDTKPAKADYAELTYLLSAYNKALESLRTLENDVNGLDFMKAVEAPKKLPDARIACTQARAEWHSFALKTYGPDHPYTPSLAL